MFWTNFGREKTLENILRRYFSSDFSALDIFLILVFRPPSPSIPLQYHFLPLVSSFEALLISYLDRPPLSFERRNRNERAASAKLYVTVRSGAQT